MNKFISIFIILSLSFYSLEVEDTSYSLILKYVRKNTVNQAYLQLPKRSQVNILKMCNLISQEKENYSLNDYEAVYLVYYWIGQNIEIDCSNSNSKYESAITAYNEGKSSYVGTSALFSTMVSTLGYKSNYIEGTLKAIVNNNKGEVVSEMDHLWDYVLINGQYYLFDPTLAAGSCDNTFRKFFSDFYFGTVPQFFIRTHYPESNKWQLLTTTVSKEKFTSWAYINKYFYLYGFKTVNPETDNLTVNQNSEINLTYDKTRDIVISCNKVVYSEKYYYYNFACSLSDDGTGKIKFQGDEKMDDFIIYSKPRGEKTAYAIVIYKVKNN